MEKSIACKDLGMECDWSAKAGSEEELLGMAGAHAATAHGITEMPAGMLDQVRSVIRDVA